MDPLTEAKPTLVDLVEAVRQLEYGRPSEGSIEAMVRERRGTCSAKHLFLARRLESLLPGSQPQIVHRVYRIDRKRAIQLFDEQAADAVPINGLVDVHRYLTAVVDGRRIVIDATFPGPAWDGVSDMPLSCGPGQDYPSVGDPDAEKRRLEAEHCDPELRERFIAALSSRASEASCAGPFAPSTRFAGELVRPTQQALMAFGCAGDRQLAEQLAGAVGDRGCGMGVFVGVDADRDHFRAPP